MDSVHDRGVKNYRRPFAADLFLVLMSTDTVSTNATSPFT